jgi:hypothetical protein
LLIGNTTGNTLAKSTLTAGTNVTVTNGSGTITIAATVDVTNVLAATANATAGAIGTYVWAYPGSIAVTANTTYAGSTLKYSGITADSGTSANSGVVYTTGAALTGTWKAMGTWASATNNAGLYLRIS